jgi:tellurite resistance protein
MDMEAMSSADRMSLIQMACVAAWSDMDIAPQERTVVLELAAKLALNDSEVATVESWLKSPPPEFDPYSIPRAYREAFLAAMVKVANADGRIDPEETETFRLIRELIS